MFNLSAGRRHFSLTFYLFFSINLREKNGLKRILTKILVERSVIFSFYWGFDVTLCFHFLFGLLFVVSSLVFSVTWVLFVAHKGDKIGSCLKLNVKYMADKKKTEEI